MKAIEKAWIFASSSGLGTHETLQYDDGSTSCGCPGWTRRVSAGQRTCRHIRLVDMGRADTECVSMRNYGRPVICKISPPVAALESATPKNPTLGVIGARKLSL